MGAGKVCVGVAVACVCAFGAGRAVSNGERAAQETLAPPFDVSSIDHNKMMQKMQEVATPGKEHELMTIQVGTWDTTMKLWMGGNKPGSQPLESTGIAEVKWVLGGRFLEEKSSGMIMGQPYEGMNLFGYDVFARKYVTVHADNMNTAMYTAEGHASMDGKSIILYGVMDEASLDIHGREVKYVLRIITPDHLQFDMYDLHIGEEHNKVGQIDYRRRG